MKYRKKFKSSYWAEGFELLFSPAHHAAPITRCPITWWHQANPGSGSGGRKNPPCCFMETRAKRMRSGGKVGRPPASKAEGRTVEGSRNIAAKRRPSGKRQKGRNFSHRRVLRGPGCRGFHGRSRVTIRGACPLGKIAIPFSRDSRIPAMLLWMDPTANPAVFSLLVFQRFQMTCQPIHTSSRLSCTA